MAHAAEVRNSTTKFQLVLASLLLFLLGTAPAQAQLALDMRVSPDPVQPGELLRYEFTVTDAGAGTATNVTLHSTTSASIAIVATDGGSCNLTFCAAGSVVTWNLGTLSPGQSVTRSLISRVGASVAAGTMVFNSAQVTASNAPEVDVSRSVSVDPTRTLAVAIVEAAVPAVLGEQLTYVVNFANRGNTADAGVVLQAAVPDGTQFVSATVGGTELAGVVSWSLGTLGVGQSGERRFTVEVTDAGAAAVFSFAELSDAANPGVARVRAETAAPVEVAPPLALEMTLTPDPVQPGELLRVELTVRNRSQITLSTVSLQHQTLDGTTVVFTDGGTCSLTFCASGSLVTWMLGTLSPGQSVQRQLILRAGAALPAGTLLFNSAHVAATNAPEVQCDRVVPVDPARALVAALTEASEPAVPGEPLTYVVNFANLGNTADAGVVLRAAVPDGTQFVSATLGGTEQDGIVTWTLGTVGVGQSGERRFTVQVMDMAPEAVFSAAELSDAQSPGVARVRAEAAAPVQAAPPLALDMTLTPDPVQPSELLRVELTVRNRSQITLSSVSLQHQTLDGTTIVSTDGGICSLTFCASGSLVTWTLGTLSPGQSVQRQLILRAGATLQAGTLLYNTAHVTATNAPEVHCDRAVPVDPARALALALAEAAEPAVPDEALTYIVNFANLGNTADAGVVLRTAVPDGTQFVSATLGGTEQDGVVTWTLGSVGVGQSGERRFTVQVIDAAPEAVFSAAELSDAQSPGVARARAEAAAPVEVAPPLALDMTLTPDPVKLSELLRVELTVRNRSQITLTDATLRHQTLDGTTIVSTDGGICSLTFCAAGSLVTWTLGTLSPGQSVQRQLILRAGATPQAGTLLYNTAHLTASNAPEVHGDRSVPVDPARALAVAIAEQTAPAVPGEPLTYIISFANSGNSSAPDAMAHAVVPAGTQFVSATQDGIEQDGVVSWSLGTVGVGQSGERRFTVQVADVAVAPEALFSAADLSDVLAPGVPQVRGEAAAPVVDVPPLDLDVTLTPTLVAPSGAVHYEFTVHNTTQITVTAATLQDLTLDGTSIVAANGGTCNLTFCAAGSTVTWALGDLAPDESATRTLDLTVQPSVPGGVLVFNSVGAGATNASSVRVDRSARVCTVSVCEPIPPTPTPTVTPTPTITPTRTNTATPTSTGTVTQTGTQTLTPTVTPTPTVTSTASETPTPTDTATPTATSTHTRTPTDTPTPTSTSTLTPTRTPLPCVGDCNGNEAVTVNELLTMVGVSLGSLPVTACEAGDPSHDGAITINEILIAVNNALTSCPMAS